MNPPSDFRPIIVVGVQPVEDPDHHILEDTGRIVFPSAKPPAVPGRLALTTGCQVK
jgi:hypothetical protein